MATTKLNIMNRTSKVAKTVGGEDRPSQGLRY